MLLMHLMNTMKTAISGEISHCPHTIIITTSVDDQQENAIIH